MESRSSFIIVGQGSMGKRRVRCLLANGILPDQITVFDTREDRLTESRKEYGVHTSSDFEGALKDEAVIAVIVSVPGFLHTQYCMAAARAGKHWFCEVPLSVNLEGVEELLALTKERGLVGAAGCQVLFHPLGVALHEWSQSACGGDVLAGSYTLGTYLPEWHPHEDYRKSYASNKAMGGGNLDVIAQELTWIRRLFNRPLETVTCRSSKVSSLELAQGTPDHQEIILEFQGGSMLSMHFDLLDRSHERTLRLVTEASTVKWSNFETALHIFDNAKGKWEAAPQPEGFIYETCYQNEIGHFLKCVRKGESWPLPLELPREIVSVLLALDRSEQLNRTVCMSEVCS